MNLPSDNFRGDIKGYAGNQCGHMVLGIGAYALLGLYGGAGVALVASAYLIIVEGLIQRLALLWDSVEDAAMNAILKRINTENLCVFKCDKSQPSLGG